MQRPYLLPPGHRTIPLAALRYPGGHQAQPSLLRTKDPATTIMVDLQRDSVLTVTEETDLQAALNAMFRLGLRVLLVVRDDAMIGVLSLRDARRLDGSMAGSGKAADGARVADVMVPWRRVPTIDWQMLQQCRIGDLAEIFAGSGEQYLVVLEDETPRSSRVRGLIARERLGAEE